MGTLAIIQGSIQYFMGPEDLLHEVNNQFEIVTSAAALLNLRNTDPHLKELASTVQTAIFNVSAILNAHFKDVIANQSSAASPAAPALPLPADSSSGY